MSEGQGVDLDVFNRLSGNLRRIFETLGLDRKARDINHGPLHAHFNTGIRRRASLRRSKTNRSAITNGNRQFALGGDGRGAWVRRWRDLTELHMVDIGDEAALSEGQKSLCRRAATLEVNLEQLEAKILAAIRPSMLTTRGQLVGISSPYARRGVLYTTFCKHFGEAGSPRILVAKASSLRMNATIDPQDIADAYEDDPIAAAAEFGGEFRVDVENFVGLDVVLSAVDKGIYERPPRHGVAYRGFCDPSGGHSDSYTLAVAHCEATKSGSAGRLVLDLVREVRPPMSPEAVTASFADDLRDYGLRTVVADRWGSSWVEERFLAEGIAVDQSADPKSVIYSNFLPLLNSGRVVLLDNSRLVSQLVGLERRTARGGRDTIDHAPGSHDDMINAAAGALVLAAARPVSNRAFWSTYRGGF